MATKLLSEILKDIPQISFEGQTNILVSGLTHNSKEVKRGFVFAALPGFKQDGFDYLTEALERGAVCCLIPEERKEKAKEKKLQPLCWVYSSSIRQTFALLCKNFYDKVDEKITLVGITGTQGKTTTTYLIRNILLNAGLNAGLIGTIKHFDGEEWHRALNTTPESLAIYRILNKLFQKNIKHCVMEVSSHALALDRVYGLSFNIAGLTNLGQDHLDFHKTIEDYKKSKFKLFSYVKANGYSIVNIDDDFGREIYLKIKNEKKANSMTYGLKNPDAQIRAEILESSLLGQKILVNDGFSLFAIKTPLLGTFNVYNILLSFGVAYALGIKRDIVVQGIESFRGVEGRLERIINDKGVLAFVDYAHTPQSLEQILLTLLPNSKKLILVFGCGGERDKTKRPLMGKIATSLADFVIVTQDNTRGEKAEEIFADIEKGIKENALHNKLRATYIIEPDRKKAIEKAVKMAKKGETILVAGKGHENYQIIGEKTYYFDDREVLKRYLNE